MTTTPEISTTATSTATHVVLVPGFWLGGWVWDDVVPVLRDAGLVPHPVTLPGLEHASSDRAGLTWDDHVDAVLTLVDGLDGNVLLVGHSGGATVVQGVVDRRPERIAGVVYVDSGPLLDGVALREGPARGPDLPLPGWEELEAEGNSAAGLDEATRTRFRERAVPHPAGVATSPVRMTDERRLRVPVTVVCTSLPAELLGQLVAAGQIPAELPLVDQVEYLDLPTGHWPMLSRPQELARVIADVATRSAPSAQAGGGGRRSS